MIYDKYPHGIIQINQFIYHSYHYINLSKHFYNDVHGKPITIKLYILTIHYITTKLFTRYTEGV